MLKWVSSFPENVAAGMPRASAVLILNDHDTGYPFACLEASIISATRTAASAALAADWLSRGRPRPTRVGFVGVGLIARYIHTFLAGTGWSFDEIGVHDLSAEQCGGVRAAIWNSPVPPAGSRSMTASEELIRSSDLVVFATVAAQPHVSDLSWFAHNPLVLHVSLRDLAPEILLASTNVVDDVDHCLKANTSPHLTEQLTGSRDFLLGTLADVMAGRVTVPAGRPVIFSPFGLACSTWRSANTSTTRWHPPATCTSSTASSTNCAATAEHHMLEVILPAGVESQECFGDSPGGVLFRRRSRSSLTPWRRDGVTTPPVRSCARACLARLGYPPVPILPGVGGAPTWPAGIRGSMTHCTGYAAAAVGTVSRISTIGIDAEPDAPLPDGVLGLIATPAEQDRLAATHLEPDGPNWDRLLFSAKEAVYKAWFPLVGEVARPPRRRDQLRPTQPDLHSPAVPRRPDPQRPPHPPTPRTLDPAARHRSDRRSAWAQQETRSFQSEGHAGPVSSFSGPVETPMLARHSVEEP